MTKATLFAIQQKLISLHCEGETETFPAWAFVETVRGAMRAAPVGAVVFVRRTVDGGDTALVRIAERSRDRARAELTAMGLGVGRDQLARWRHLVAEAQSETDPRSTLETLSDELAKARAGEFLLEQLDAPFGSAAKEAASRRIVVVDDVFGRCWMARISVRAVHGDDHSISMPCSAVRFDPYAQLVVSGRGQSSALSHS